MNQFILRTFVAVLIGIIPGYSNAQKLSQHDKLNQSDAAAVKTELKQLESSFGGKLGVYAIDTNNSQVISYRQDEYFPIQSTLKLIAVAAMLKQAQHQPNLLNQKINYTNKDIIAWHPITGQYLNQGMTIKELAEAAITYSDNPAANLIIQKLGGPSAINNFAHSIGNHSFNVSHYEGQLNSNPQSHEDSATPKDMAISAQKILLGNVLQPGLKDQLITWMKNDTVGYTRMRAGVPIGYTVADKTGSGSYGVANDIGIIWSPLCKPIVVAIYSVNNNPKAKRRDDIVAKATAIIIDSFEKNNSCGLN